LEEAVMNKSSMYPNAAGSHSEELYIVFYSFLLLKFSAFVWLRALINSAVTTEKFAGDIGSP
jgi:hypothetical protein